MELHQTFDDFITGKMDAKQQAEFEARLEQDESFRKEYMRHICLVEGINQYERERLKQFITGRSGHSKIRNNRPTRSLKILFAAAAVIFLLLIPSFVIYKNIRFPFRIYKQFYFEDPGLPVVMGNTAYAGMDEAMTAFKAKNYNGALLKLETLAASDQKNDTINYYSGICYLQTNQAAKAISCFDKIGSAASPYYYLSKYFTGLGYIKLRDYSKAQEVLTEVLKCGDCFVADKARKLIEEL